MNNLTNLTPEKSWRAPFLEALRTHGVISAAAKVAGISRWTVYHEKNTDPIFALEWDEALSLGVEALEDAAKERAFKGSDVLLIFLLKAHKPEKYRERIEQRQTGGLTIKVEYADTDADPAPATYGSAESQGIG